MSKVGIEVETSRLPGWRLTPAGWQPDGARAEGLTQYWVAHLDGSVTGLELVLRRPLAARGVAFHRALASLGAELAEAEFDANCSTHIHVDCEQDPYVLFRTLLLSALLEEAVFEYIGCPRTNTNFATPLRAEDQLEHYIRQEGDWAPNRPLQGFENRYLWVNPLAFLKHGSIEFRIFDGTGDITTINEWVNLCEGIVRYAKGMGARGHEGLLNPPATLIRDVAPILSRGALLDELTLRTSVRNNLPLIYALVDRLTVWESHRGEPRVKPVAEPVAEPVDPTLPTLRELNAQLNQPPLPEAANDLDEGLRGLDQPFNTGDDVDLATLRELNPLLNAQLNQIPLPENDDGPEVAW